jgi:phage I-like protein
MEVTALVPGTANKPPTRSSVMKKALLVLLTSIALTSAASAADKTAQDCSSCCKDCASCCETATRASDEKKADAGKQTSTAKPADKAIKIAKKS